MAIKKRNPISEIREIRSAIRAAQAAAVAAQAAAERVATQAAADKAAVTSAAAEMKAKAEAGIITMTLSGKPEDLNRFQGTQGKSPSAEIVSGLSWASAMASLNYNYIANKIPSWIRRKSRQVPEVSKEKPNGVKTNGGVGGNGGGGAAKENNGGGGGVKENGGGGVSKEAGMVAGIVAGMVAAMVVEEAAMGE